MSKEKIKDESVEIEEKPKAKKALDLSKKEAAIRESKMPEDQKNALLKKIGLSAEKEAEGVEFAVYAKIRKISKEQIKAMSVYPAAKKIRLATFKEWDEIFKNF